ncbi:unnamed protein product [Schistosoma turkestanicum]|nr:unnamed protein product [Schistosoma turkestanicum]
MCISQPVSSSSRKSCPSRSQVRNRHSKQSSKRHVDLVTDYKTRPDRMNFRCSESEKSLEIQVDGYVQVSSQFVLIPGSTYFKTNNDGTPPQWDEVSFVKVLNKGDLVCPICLYPPVTPRMGKCGHIYCWPCALQYIKYENESDIKKCSVCPSLLALNELKRVSLTCITPTKVGDEIRLELVKRSGPCVTPLLSPQTCESTSGPLFECVCVADPVTIKNIHESEIDELRTYRTICEVDENNMELIPFIDFVFEELSQEELLQKPCSNSSAKPCESCSQDINEVSTNKTYFYQAANSQPIFLDSLGWRCLLTEYTEVQNLPKEIVATVVSTRSFRMNPSLRKPLRYLNHLPDGYAFNLVEIKLEPPLVSELTLSHFATALNNRALERDRSRLEDLKLTELKEAAENQFMSLRELISRACIPGILNKAYDHTGTNSLNLCELCTGGNADRCRRDNLELYYGDAGAFRCLIEGADIAFARHTTVHTNTGGRNPNFWARDLREDNYELLCPDGRRAEAHDWLHCNLGKIPSNVVVTANYKSENERTNMWRLLQYGQEYYSSDNDPVFQMFNSEFGQKDLIFSDDTESLNLIPWENQTYEAWLGVRFIQIIENLQIISNQYENGLYNNNGISIHHKLINQSTLYHYVSRYLLTILICFYTYVNC